MRPVRVIEGGKERVQVFEGVVIGQKEGGLRSTFTVRKISNGVGVERVFPRTSEGCKDRSDQKRCCQKGKALLSER